MRGIDCQRHCSGLQDISETFKVRKTTEPGKSSDWIYDCPCTLYIVRFQLVSAPTLSPSAVAKSPTCRTHRSLRLQLDDDWQNWCLTEPVLGNVAIRNRHPESVVWKPPHRAARFNTICQAQLIEIVGSPSLSIEMWKLGIEDFLLAKAAISIASFCCLLAAKIERWNANPHPGEFQSPRF